MKDEKVTKGSFKATEANKAAETKKTEKTEEADELKSEKATKANADSVLVAVLSEKHRPLLTLKLDTSAVAVLTPGMQDQLDAVSIFVLVRMVRARPKLSVSVPVRNSRTGTSNFLGGKVRSNGTCSNGARSATSMSCRDIAPH